MSARAGASGAAAEREGRDEALAAACFDCVGLPLRAVEARPEQAEVGALLRRCFRLEEAELKAAQRAADDRALNRGLRCSPASRLFRMHVCRGSPSSQRLSARCRFSPDVVPLLEQESIARLRQTSHADGAGRRAATLRTLSRRSAMKSSGRSGARSRHRSARGFSAGWRCIMPVVVAPMVSAVSERSRSPVVH